MQNSIIVQATVVRQNQRRYEWLASALWRECFKPFETQTYVSSTIIAIGKWGFYRHVASVKSSPSNIVHDTHDSHVKRPFVLRSPLYHLNTIIALLSTTGATTGKHARARTQNTYGQLWLRLKRITDLITTSIVNRPLFPRNSRQLK